MKLRIASLMVLICGASLFAFGLLRSRKAEATGITAARPFVVQYLVSRLDNGSLKPYEYRIRAVSADGEWKETRYSFEGKVSTWGGTKEGLYLVANGVRQYYGEFKAEISRSAMRSEYELKNSPQLTRVEQIAGLKTYILKNKDGDEGGYSPETGITTLKEVAHSKDSSDTVVHSLEALSVEFRELSPNELQLEDLPIRFDIANKKVAALERSGLHDAAEALRKAINRMEASSK